MEKTRAARAANSARRKAGKQKHAAGTASTPLVPKPTAAPSSVRSIRVPDYLWAAIERLAGENNLTPNKVAVQFLAQMAGVTLPPGRKPRSRSANLGRRSRTQPPVRPVRAADAPAVLPHRDRPSEIDAVIRAVREARGWPS